MEMICNWPKLVGDNTVELVLTLIAHIKSFEISRIEKYVRLANGCQIIDVLTSRSLQQITLYGFRPRVGLFHYVIIEYVK